MLDLHCHMTGLEPIQGVRECFEKDKTISIYILEIAEHIKRL